MKQRKPKDLDRYIRVVDAAQGLREVADRLQKSAIDDDELVKWELKLSYWRPEAPRG